ncbi:hypothetical protein EXE46_15070 [Halorubrum sp. GN11_10-6_MGM]|uniref:DUF7509 family protein n=1 Tax=Halorubrum sp. GN11_10-6_MGM TaxID=2518112 RepID=UPI0010FA0173|nr:hypothetical protein [Halorubrum sp. GN11_10-6_MGM]TKX73080.1 hypothetical protein EXE46_15070 [Halorubrum sp. GN11_10-6_MGM]
MTAEITRDLIAERLGHVTYDRFLFYLMGPYKSFNLNYILSEEERQEIDVGDLPGPLRQLFQNKEEIDAAQALLRRVQGALRVRPGVNAFLALDVDVDTDEVDAATQSIEYTQCSNATAFILPFLGHNFGVGEEAGSVLEALSETHGDRLVFVHEDDVTSAMIRSAQVRWDLRVAAYETEAELISKLRLFAGGIMHQERRGELDQLD